MKVKTYNLKLSLLFLCTLLSACDMLAEEAKLALAGKPENYDYIEIYGTMPKGSLITAYVKYTRQEKPDGSCGEVYNSISGFYHVKTTGQAFRSESIDDTHYRIRLATEKKDRHCHWKGTRIGLEFDNTEHDFPADDYNLKITENIRKHKVPLGGILTTFFLYSDEGYAKRDDKEDINLPRQVFICNVSYAFTGHKEYYHATIGRCYDRNRQTGTDNRHIYSKSWLMEHKKIRLDFALNPEFWCARCPERVRQGMQLNERPEDDKKWPPPRALYEQLLPPL